MAARLLVMAPALMALASVALASVALASMFPGLGGPGLVALASMARSAWPGVAMAQRRQAIAQSNSRTPRHESRHNLLAKSSKMA
jgi:hypothetical protein